MSLTKEECIRRLKEARSTIQPYCYVNEALDYAIKKLQNPPLKFEQLKEGMWVWDNKYKEYCFIYFIAGKYPHRLYIDNCQSDSEFEENRFFLKEVKDDAKGSD